MNFKNTGEKLTHTYAHRFIGENEVSDSKLKKNELMKNELNESGIKDPRAVYRIIHDELQLNNKPTLNLATFVSTWMEDEARQLAMESLDVNLVDQSIYPMTTEIQRRITNIIAKMLHADMPENSKYSYIGTSTVGSSEAVMLGILAHKTRWLEWYDGLDDKTKAQYKRTPNLVIGGAYQVCWEKVYKFFDIEGDKEAKGKKCRIIPLDGDRRVVTAESIKECISNGLIDDNTVALGLVLGTTLTGEMDEIIEINDIIKEYNINRQKRGIPSLPIHVDAAYGGFVLPFTEDKFAWDFRASEVKSINVSNHKFGLVYPGLGTVVFKNENVVPKSLFTKVNYLGEEIYDYSINFSRSSFQVICQYYNFLRFGKSGYKNIMSRILDNATKLATGLLEFKDDKGSSYFELLTSHKKEKNGSIKVRLPNVVVKVNRNAPFKADELSDMLKMDGWAVPAYNLPENLDRVSVLRMVVKENFSEDMVALFISSMNTAINKLKKAKRKHPDEAADNNTGIKIGTNIIC